MFFKKQKSTAIITISWLEIFWQRTFDFETVEALLLHLAAHHPKLTIIWEIRGYQGQVRHFIGVDRNYAAILMSVLKAHGDIRSGTIWPNARLPVNAASQLKSSGVVYSLNTEANAETVIYRQTGNAATVNVVHALALRLKHAHAATIAMTATAQMAA